jgi:transcriptional regulator with XRE-family HTH domain
MAESPICKRLKEARIAAGISQKKLGIAAGMDEFSASSRMNHYELGRHQPDFETLKRIAKVLKLPVAYFYAEEDELAKLIWVYALLSKAARRALIDKFDL